MIADVEFFKSKLSKLNGATELGDQLIQVIRNKPISTPPQPRESTDSQAQLTRPSTDTTQSQTKDS
jgi:hypothetical protein